MHSLLEFLCGWGRGRGCSVFFIMKIGNDIMIKSVHYLASNRSDEYEYLLSFCQPISMSDFLSICRYLLDKIIKNNANEIIKMDVDHHCDIIKVLVFLYEL